MMKYKRVSGRLKMVDEIIHPMWLIDEYVSILRVWVWINPIMEPTSKEAKIVSQINFGNLNKISRVIGFIFWIERRINKIGHIRRSTMLGSHEWNGAAPSLIIIVLKIMMSKIILLSSKESGTEIEIKNRIEASVCLRKYLMAASLLSYFLGVRINGIKLRVFSSNAIQVKNSDDEEIIIIILVKILIKNINIEGEKNIREKDYPIDGAWAHKLKVSLSFLRVDVEGIVDFDSISIGAIPMHVILFIV